MSGFQDWSRQLQQQGSPTFMCNPRNARHPRTTPGSSHATDFMSAPVFRRETAGFTIQDSLAAANSVTRLNRVHLRYGSHLRTSCTLHDLLPPHAAKLLDSRTEIRESPGISPGGFLSIYTRLVAYPDGLAHTNIHVRVMRKRRRCRVESGPPRL